MKRPSDERRERSQRPGRAEPSPRRSAERPTRREAVPVGSGLIYGLLPVIEALRANSRRVDKILIADGSREKRLDEVFDLARAGGILIDRVSRENLTRITGPDVNHQGVVAIAASADYVPIDDLLSDLRDPALLVVLDGVEDPRNLGAVLRTVECSGADGVVIPDRRAVGLTDTVAKSSAGATEHVKVAKVANLNRLIDELKRRNIWVVGTSGEAEMSYTEWDWKQPSALVLGAEGSGLHRLVSENCDVLVKIPMYGKIESLNVSVAAGVVLFEAKRQRDGEDR